MEKTLFSALGLSPEILKAVDALGFEEASPIQAAAIPVLMSGRDIVGQSQTGSGKTAAFAIPAIEKIDVSSMAVQVLILCPTRELATQVAEEVHKLTAFKRGIHSVPIYGGASYERQFYELKKGVQIVIGTPGRLIDHLNRGTLKLDSLKVVILDEADRMLDMGFRDDIQLILDAAPKERQTVFFSATVSKQIRDLITRYSRDPESVRIDQKEVSAPAIEQWYYEAHSRMKVEALLRLIDFHGFKLGIIFCNTQRMVDELADTLMAQGFSADRLHGGIPQAQRTRVMNKFKKSEFEFLVATDVAARGIDVDDLELVVNYDLPYDAEDYVHRIGRTGRAGKRGMAVTFVSGRDIYKLQFIEKFTRTKIRRGILPTVGEVEEKKADILLDKVRDTLASGEGKAQSTLVDRLLEEGFNSTDIAAALLQLLVGGQTETAPPKPSATAPREADQRPPRESSRYSQDSRESQSRSPRDRDSRPQSREPDRREPDRRDAPRREAPPTRNPRAEAAATAPARKDFTERAPILRSPSRGMQWISLDVGRQENFGPREIVDLIEEGSGLPGKNVGAIEITTRQTFAQVPESFVQGLSSDGNSFAFQGGQVTIRAVSHGKDVTPDARKGKFRKKY